MCVNFDPAEKESLEERRWWDRHVRFTPDLYLGEAFPGRQAPFLANCLPDDWLSGLFGLVPHWGDPTKLYRMTYNARSETVAEKPSFKNSWKHRQFALIPAQNFYEPNYESGKAVRWRIERADGAPFALAGLWERRMGDEGPAHWSFSLLTINADEHPLMRRFHKPGEEKRSVVVLAPEDEAAWMSARTEAEARALLQPFDPELMTAQADPVPVKAKVRG